MKKLRQAWRRVRAALGGERGFTLTELAVVIAIIGILASAAVPTYRGVVSRSYETEAKNIITEIRSLAWNFYLENGRWPGFNADCTAGANTWDVDLGNYVQPGGRFTYAMNTCVAPGANPGTINIRATGAAGPTNGWTVTLTVNTNGQATGDFAITKP